MLKFGLLFFLLNGVLLSCTVSPKVKTFNIYIPDGYVGWVAIVFNQPKSQNDFTFKDDKIECFIKDKPCFFGIKSHEIKEGYYDFNYYYFDKGDTSLLQSTGLNRNVSDGGVKMIQDENKKTYYYSFYVSNTIKKTIEINNMNSESDICFN